jgi:hypothetical protein
MISIAMFVYWTVPAKTAKPISELKNRMDALAGILAYLGKSQTLSDVRLSGQQKTFYCHWSCNRNDPKSEGLLVSKNTDPCGIGDFCAHIQSNSIFPRIWMIPTSPCKYTILNHSAIGPMNVSRQYTPLDEYVSNTFEHLPSNNPSECTYTMHGGQ